MAQTGSTLTVAWDSDIDSLDPHVFKSIGGYAVECNIYDSVVGWKVRPVDGKPGLSQAYPRRIRGRQSPNPGASRTTGKTVRAQGSTRT